MIYTLKEKWAIEPIKNMILKRSDLFKITEDKLKERLTDGIENEASIIILDEKNGKVNGFVFASIENFNGEDVCFISACIVSPEMKQTVHDFIAKLKKWSKEKGLKRMILSTENHIEGFKKKYGFKYHATLLDMSV